MKSSTWILVYDLHYPAHDPAAWAALCDYLKHNKIDGFIFGGDQLDMQEVSHWTRGKGIYRPQGALAANLKGFNHDILDPLDKLLGRGVKRVWLNGNHERFLTLDMFEDQPELDGVLSLDAALKLQDRGYRVVGHGGYYQLGNLIVLHGDGIGGANPAKKAVETWGQNVVLGHHHTLQQYTKDGPAQESKRFTGTALPCMSGVNPGYGRGRGNKWLTGFGIVSVRPGGKTNIYPIVISGGQFATPDGAVYGKQLKRTA